MISIYKVQLWLILLYFPSMIFANISGLKVNYLVALLCVVSASLVLLKKRGSEVLFIMLCVLLIIAKLVFSDTFLIKENAIIIISPSVFIASVISFQMLAVKDKFKIAQLTIGLALFEVCIVVLQYLELLPVTMGKLSFVNSIGYDLSGEEVNRVRANGFMYHPFDAALYILPFVFLTLLKTLHLGKKTLLDLCLLIVMLYLTVMASISIYLKSFILFQAMFVAFVLVKRTIGLSLMSMTIMGILAFLSLVLTVEVSNEFSAGRVLIWGMMLDIYITYHSLTDILFGFNSNLLALVHGWKGDLYLSHNQYLFLALYSGVLISCYFVLRAIHIFSLLKTSNQLTLSVIVCLFFSMGMTGDLIIFFSFWVMACQLISIEWLFKQRERKHAQG